MMPGMTHRLATTSLAELTSEASLVRTEVRQVTVAEMDAAVLAEAWSCHGLARQDQQNGLGRTSRGDQIHRIRLKDHFLPVFRGCHIPSAFDDKLGPPR